MPTDTHSSGLQLHQYDLLNRIEEGDEIVYVPPVAVDSKEVAVCRGVVEEKAPHAHPAMGEDDLKVGENTFVKLDWIVEVK